MGAVILRRDRVVLIERGRQPQQGRWSLPGGLVEVGERLQQAVRREVLEETGLTVQPVGLVEVFERIVPEAGERPEYHYVLIDYLCKVTGGELRAGDDARRAAWVRRKDLPGRDLTSGTLAVIEKAFRLRSEGK